MSRSIVTLTLNPAVDISTTVDRLVPTHKLRCGPERRDAGGGGINVARVLRRLGAEPLAIFPAGGPIGNLLEDLVAAEGVARLVIPIAGNTREDLTVNELATGAEYRFVLPGPTLSPLEADICCDVLAAQAVQGGIVVASGSLPPGLPSDFYARLARLAEERGARFVLDASGAALKSALDAGVYLIKPSQRELSELAGVTLEDRDACIREAQRLVAKGAAKLVALSLGESGAVLVGDGFALRAAAPAVKVVSTVGAGDSFLAALVWSLAQGQTPGEALRLAVAAGSAALLSPGTGLCQIADVLRLKDQVRTSPVEDPAPLSV